MLVVEVDVVELELELEPVTVSEEPAMTSETEARSELQRRLINQEVHNYRISEIRRATSSEAAELNLPAGSIILLN